MKRCYICDSTEAHDTLINLGFKEPITHWHIDKTTNEYLCNRCEREISLTAGFFPVTPIEDVDADPYEYVDVDDDDIEFIEALTKINGKDFDDEWNSRS